MGELAKDLFQDEGFRVSWARSSQQALDFADDARPDAVILELSLPAHNGVEFLHEFRSYADWMNIPVVVYSFLEPDRTQSGRQTMKSLGVTEHFYKPTTTLARLLQKTKEILE